MGAFIYADNAATTRLDEDAFEAMKPYHLDCYANASQPYSFATKAKRAIQNARETIAECIGADADEIFFTSGGTESNNWAIKSSTLKRICGIAFTTKIEHHSVLNSYAALEKRGFAVEYMAVPQSGVIMPEILHTRIGTRLGSTANLVSIMMVNNEIGTIEPIAELVPIAHNRDALFHTDAVQAVGHIPIDAHALGVDLLSASAHKFNGPKGVGFLYIKKDTSIRPFMNGGAQESGMRAGTENVASIVGMATALQKNCTNMNETTTRLRCIEKMFIDTLNHSRVDYIRNGGKERVPNIISLSFPNVNGETLLYQLDSKGICVSTGSACDSGNMGVSHVIEAIGIPQDYAEGTIRVSFGRDNTVDEAQEVANAIVKILKA